MKKYLTLRNLLAVVLLIVIIFIASQPYLQKALIHQQADIDDYKIFANRPVKTGTYQPWKIAADYNKKPVRDSLLTAIEGYETVAFLVIQNGEIRHEQYWDGYGPTSLSNSFSMAKSIVSLLVGMAIDEGKIKNVDQYVSDFLPEFKGGKNGWLTIKHLLTMSSGLNWNESYSNPFSVTTKAYYGNSLRDLVLNLKVEEDPGITNRYLSGNTQLLAFVLEKATGKPLSEYASEKLWKPLGAHYDALWSLDKEGGEEKAYCCFNSNAQDFARLGQLVLNRGRWNGRQLISEKYMSAAISRAAYLNDEAGDPVNYYGYQFWVVEYKDLRITYFRGILGQYIFIIPEKNAVVVRLGKVRGKPIGHHPTDIFVYLDAALALLD